LNDARPFLLTRFPAQAYVWVSIDSCDGGRGEPVGFRSCLAATFTSFIGVSAPEALSATTHPDLVEASLSKPPPARLPGDSFAITDKVKNAGTARAGKSTTRYYLSLDQRKGASDILLAASRSVRALNPGQSSSGKANLQIPVTAPLALYFVLACADGLNKVRESSEGKNCRASPSRISVTRDSIQRILDELSAATVAAREEASPGPG
jgi:CARDB protein